MYQQTGSTMESSSKGKEYILIQNESLEQIENKMNELIGNKKSNKTFEKI